MIPATAGDFADGRPGQRFLACEAKEFGRPATERTTTMSSTTDERVERLESGVVPGAVSLAEKFQRFTDHWSPKVVSVGTDGSPLPDSSAKDDDHDAQRPHPARAG